MTRYQQLHNCKLKKDHYGSNINYLGLDNIWFKLIILLINILYYFSQKWYLLPVHTPTCIEDYVLDIPFLANINYEINNDETIGNFILILTQIIMDFTCISITIYWLLYVQNIRFPICGGVFYFLRLFFVHGFQMKFPEGYYWKYPGFPSILTPYDYDYSDFFFSGHCGVLMLIILEWKRLGKDLMVSINVFLLIIVIFNLLALRVHYWIDIAAGIIFAHYLYLWIEHFQDELEIFVGSIRVFVVYVIFGKVTIRNQNQIKINDNNIQKKTCNLEKYSESQ